jgi:hypothetical protein
MLSSIEDKKGLRSNPRAFFRANRLERVALFNGVLNRRQAAGAFEGGDFVGVLKRQCDVIEAVQQAMAAEGLDLEGAIEPVVVAQPAGLEVGGQLVSGILCRAREQLVHCRIVQPDREHAVLEAVVVEDVGETRRDEHAKSVVGKRPGGVLAARATAEVAPRQEDAGTAVFGPVQLEIGIVRPVVVKPPIEEQVLSKAGSLDPLEELLGDDLVGIDVGPVHGSDEAGVGGVGLHAEGFGVQGSAAELLHGGGDF